MSVMNTYTPKEVKIQVVRGVSTVDRLRLETANQLYIIDLDQWGIYNDGTHETETENGINNAIVWAKSNGYDGAYLKAGTYLIEPTYHQSGILTNGASPGMEKFTTSLRGIKLVSDFFFEMSPNTIIQVKTNNAHMHTAILAYKVNNTTIRGGQVIGDKDTHIWTAYAGYGTGGHGYGMFIQQSNNIKIYDTIFTKHHGDGVIVYDGMDRAYMSDSIYMKNVICDDNSRQGMSIVGGDNMLFEDCTFSGTNGQSPEYGVDVEATFYSSTRIIFRRCIFTKNNRGGLYNFDGNIRIEDCTFTQELGTNQGGGNVEVVNSTFNSKDSDDYYGKYPFILTIGKIYQVGDRARIDLSATSEGYTCTKAGTTSDSMTRINNYPPPEMNSSMLGIKYTYGDTEWAHTNNLYTYSASGLNGTTTGTLMPCNLRTHATIYALNDQIRLANGTSLVCTVAGTSGASAPSTSGKYTDDLLIDGTVTWKVIDSTYPKGYRKNSTVYTQGDLVWGSNRDTVWECMTGGTTGITPPTLKDLPNGATLIAHASSSRIRKIDYNLTAPDWQPKINKNFNDIVNIAGTSWQYTEKRNYAVTFAYYSSGDTEPDISNIPRGDTLIDGTVTWKKVADRLTKLIVERCTFTNVGINAGAQTVVVRNNKVINGSFVLTGSDVVSNGNIILNKGATHIVKYNLNSGLISNEIIKGSNATVIVLRDRKKPTKRLVENLSLEDSIYSSEAVLVNSLLTFTDKSTVISTQGTNRHFLMMGGRINAYLNSSAILFCSWHNYFSLKDVMVEVVLSTGAQFYKNYSKSTEGWYPIIENCTFRVTPLDFSTLFSVGYSDANIKMVNNKFFNLDYAKSILIDLPPIDTINTVSRNNFFDTNYYTVDINSINNTGGYGVKTTIESTYVPVIGKYALGTRIMSIAPTIGSPKSWITTTAGVAFSTTRVNSTVYTIGTFAKWTTGSNIYECIVAGTSASTPPTAGYGTIVDGTVSWLYRGNITAVFTSEGNL